MREEQELQQGRVELGRLIEECRRSKSISMEALCGGICGRERMRRIERGQGEVTELEIQLLMSRLHMQPYLVDYAIQETQFFRREKRVQIDKLIRKGKLEEAQKELTEYREMGEELPTHLWEQYLLWKETQLREMAVAGKELSRSDRWDIGEAYQHALERTIGVETLERRLKKNGCVSREEFEMYLGYRRGCRAMTWDERRAVLHFVEVYLLPAGLEPDVYFRMRLEDAEKCLREYKNAECIRICDELLEIRRAERKAGWQLEILLVRVKALERMPGKEEELQKDYLTIESLYSVAGRDAEAEQFRREHRRDIEHGIL